MTRLPSRVAADASQARALALQAFDRGDWNTALRAAAEVAAGRPADAGIRYVLGAAALQLGRLPLALQALGEAVRLAPERLDATAQQARALAMAGELAHAVRVAEAALPLLEKPGADAVSADTLGTVFARAGLHHRAATATRRAVALDPAHPGYRFNLATALMFEGDFDGAERECEACLAIEPRHWPAWVSLAQLRRQTPTRNHVQRLHGMLATHAGDPDAELHLRMALGKELEDLGEYPEAFDQYVAGKAAHRRRVDYRPERDRDLFEAVARAHDALPPAAAEAGHRTPAPVFVVGMPRSGTTLVDRIVSAHRLVHSAGELDAFERALWHHAGQGARSLRELLLHLPQRRIDWAALGRDYLAAAAPAAGDAERFTDKLPHNFLFLGFIARALPDARIVLVRRDPLDTCLGNLRQLFAPDARRFDYSCDPLDIGRYWLLFDRLVRHWQAVLPGRIHEVAYEDLVLDQEPATRALLAACGLEWDPAALSPERADAAIATASAVQLRSPVNRDSLQRWKRFGGRMRPLTVLLADHLAHDIS